LSLKLAEALAERSDCQKRIEELKKRIVRSAKVQEGEQPAEDANDLLLELDRLISRLLELIVAINRTNAGTSFGQNKSISDAIAEREIIAKKRDAMVGIAEAASTRQDRYSKSEVKFVATVSIAQLQKEADQLARQYREMDTRIQELNWMTELI